MLPKNGCLSSTMWRRFALTSLAALVRVKRTTCAPRGRAFSIAVRHFAFRNTRLNNFRRPPILRAVKRGFFIKISDTPNEDALKFVIVGEQVMKEGTKEFTSLREAQKSPLARELFGIPGVKSVFFGPDYITVNKTPESSWADTKLMVYDSIAQFLQSNQPLFTEEPERKDTTILPEDSETVAMIKELIETRIRPAIMEDGGDILFRAFREGVVFVQLQGSCSGCSQSSATLKGGIERMLMHWIPEVNGVVAVEEGDLERLNLEQFEKVEKDIKTKAAADAQVNTATQSQ